MPSLSPFEGQAASVSNDMETDLGAQPLIDPETPLPTSAATIFLSGLFLMATFAAAYVARDVILPIVHAFFLMLVLKPAVQLLERLYLPRAVGALLVIMVVIAAVVGSIAALSVPAATWAEKLWALLPPALYFSIHLVEGEFLTPMLLARRFTLNTVLVILVLIFWFWMWGVPGAILAVPMLAIVKIVCDRVRPLKALGHFLEG